MKSKPLQLLIAIIIISVAGCTPYKQVAYFPDISKDSIVNETIDNYKPLRLQVGDILGINVNSLSHEADLMFNYNLDQEANNTTLDRIEQNKVVGYLIDENGDVHLPLIGNVKAAELTTKELTDTITAQLQAYLSKPVVNVRILNFKISVLGDVKNPGTFNIQDEKITFTQALSLAGDMSNTAIRTNVLLIREEDGIRKYVRFNLNSKEILNSPYYYLRNNDVIYVQPGRAKVSVDSGLYAKASIIVSVLAIVAYLIRFH